MYANFPLESESGPIKWTLSPCTDCRLSHPLSIICISICTPCICSRILYLYLGSKQSSSTSTSTFWRHWQSSVRFGWCWILHFILVAGKENHFSILMVQMSPFFSSCLFYVPWTLANKSFYQMHSQHIMRYVNGIAGCKGWWASKGVCPTTS